MRAVDQVLSNFSSNIRLPVLRNRTVIVSSNSREYGHVASESTGFVLLMKRYVLLKVFREQISELLETGQICGASLDDFLYLIVCNRLIPPLRRYSVES